MFTKIHYHQQQQDQYQYHHHHHHQLSLDHHPTSEEESNGPDGCISKKPKLETELERGSGGQEDGTIEVAKRPRGRPPGSKNKPKPPIIITRESEFCAMRPLFLELPNGLDLIDAIARFTHRRNIGLTVLTASGSVANVSFRQSSVNINPTSSSTVTFQGRYEILNISATFLPPSLPVVTTSGSTSPSILPSSFMISLVGPRGQIIGGSVAGPVITAGTVFIVAGSFDNPSYHRLPIEDDVPKSVSDENLTSNEPLVQSCGMTSMYRSHVPSNSSDLIWAPTPRPSAPF
ncbi:hypothetical protein IFM89_014245 [Coptis chinensis]|uniref:AT-hook motif nuclear-localized protein n=1 Tax=Coptis chinensis TaxID=261450 RepID=A0A835MBB2_9MAGN|nr:hypothetical protein IFM89_014245 [Coptis chinensis]